MLRRPNQIDWIQSLDKALERNISGYFRESQRFSNVNYYLFNLQAVTHLLGIVRQIACQVAIRCFTVLVVKK